MLSCSSGALLLPRLGLLAIGLLLIAACGAGTPDNTSTLAASPLGAAAVAAAPAVAATPAVSAATSEAKTPQAKSSTSAPVASGGASRAVASRTPANGSSAAAQPAAVSTAVATIYGYAAPELASWSSSEQVQQLEAMKATGVTSVRVDADWSAVQPDGPDSYDWTSLDQEMASIQAAGLSADLIIDGCPSWAAVSGAQGSDSAQPASSAVYGTYAAAVAKRYSSEGARYFEIWNEPNNPEFWVPKPNPAAYTEDLKAAYAAIKAVDPTAIVISGGLAPEVDSSTSYSPLTFLQDMYADGAAGSFDGVGYHPYSYPVDPDTISSGSGWSEMYQSSPSIRSIMVANGDSAKKVWITEFGAPTSGTSTNVSEADQSEELVQAISQVKDLSWVASFYIYTWEDVNGQGFGVLTADGAQKQAYAGVVAALSTK